MKKIKNKKGIYALCSLLVVLALGITACSNSQNKVTPNSNQESVQPKNPEPNNNSSSQNTQQPKTQEKPLATKSANGPKFIKQNLPKGTKISFNTAWKNSDDGAYSACIEGKGSEALEEGVGKIVIKNNNGDIYDFEISDNKKISPRYIEWIDNENLLVVIGSSYGTVSKGGNLYLLNIPSGKSFVVFETPDKKQQIVSAQKSNDNINLKVNVYDDNNYNKSHMENWTIYSFDKNLEKKMDVKNSEGKVIYVINQSN